MKIQFSFDTRRRRSPLFMIGHQKGAGARYDVYSLNLRLIMFAHPVFPDQLFMSPIIMDILNWSFSELLCSIRNKLIKQNITKQCWTPRGGRSPPWRRCSPTAQRLASLPARRWNSKEMLLAYWFAVALWEGLFCKCSENHIQEPSKKV